MLLFWVKNVLFFMQSQQVWPICKVREKHIKVSELGNDFPTYLRKAKQNKTKLWNFRLKIVHLISHEWFIVYTKRCNCKFFFAYQSTVTSSEIEKYGKRYLCTVWDLTFWKTLHFAHRRHIYVIKVIESDLQVAQKSWKYGTRINNSIITWQRSFRRQISDK